MILTELEASKRWCPMARALYREPQYGNAYSGYMVAAVNRDTPNNTIPACIASSCAVWRWAETKKLRDLDLVTSDIEELKPRLGYCGLASKPEFGD